MLLFFDLGSGEIILILLVLFVVLGPKRLPEVARTLGKTINEMKRASAGFKNEINKEVQKLDRETRLQDFMQQKEAAKTTMEDAPVAHEPEKYSEQITNKKKQEIVQELPPPDENPDQITDTAASTQ